MATLGEWHHRPGGEWIVYKKTWGCYDWMASRLDEQGRGNPEGLRSGNTWWYWLARRRAIAALQRMRREQDKGGQA